MQSSEHHLPPLHHDGAQEQHVKLVGGRSLLEDALVAGAVLLHLKEGHQLAEHVGRQAVEERHRRELVLHKDTEDGLGDRDGAVGVDLEHRDAGEVEQLAAVERRHRRRPWHAREALDAET